MEFALASKHVCNAKSPRWTDKEVADLIAYRTNKLSVKRISKLLNRSESAISVKLRDLGIRITSVWSDEEIEFLKLKYSLSTTEELIKLFPNHTLGSINKKAKILGLSRQNILLPKWSSEEIEKLKSLVSSGKSDTEISKELNRPIYGVKCMRRNYCREYFVWSDKEINILKDKYERTTIRGLLLLLPCKTESQIRNKATKLNLHKPPSLLWSKEEVNRLIKEYPHKTIKELKAIFPDKKKKQINKKAKLLKLRKTKETLARCFSIKIGIIPSSFNKRTQWRKNIIRRDNYSCQKCGFKDDSALKLQAHHIKPVRDCSKNEVYDINNGICLCIDCHIFIKDKEYEFSHKFGGLNGIFKRG